jgi:hypothetical protein
MRQGTTTTVPCIARSGATRSRARPVSLCTRVPGIFTSSRGKTSVDCQVERRRSSRGIAQKSCKLHGIVDLWIFHEGIPHELRPFSTISSVIPDAIPTASWSYHAVNGLKAFTNPYRVQAEANFADVLQDGDCIARQDPSACRSVFQRYLDTADSFTEAYYPQLNWLDSRFESL